MNSAPPQLPHAADSLALADCSFEEIREALQSDGAASQHAAALWRWLYRSSDSQFQASKDFPPPLVRWLATRAPSVLADGLRRPVVEDEFRSTDGLTTKFLLRLADHRTVETVLMRYQGRHTVCVSSQVGCAMGCVFCATGQAGFTRHLRASEIVAQVLHARRALEAQSPGHRLRNLVMMGMGEPLHNYDAVMRALDMISNVRGIGIGPSKIAISTVGLVPAILRMAKENSPYRLAVSLHGSTEQERSALVPVSRKYPLADLIQACRTYSQTTGKRIFFEWTLIAGANDSADTAQRLVRLLRGIDSHVNLIPLNPTPNFGGDASAQVAGLAFQTILRSAGIPCTFRQRRGIDVAAGCGMLRARKPTASPSQTSSSAS